MENRSIRHEQSQHESWTMILELILKLLNHLYWGNMTTYVYQRNAYVKRLMNQAVFVYSSSKEQRCLMETCSVQRARRKRWSEDWRNLESFSLALQQMKTCVSMVTNIKNHTAVLHRFFCSGALFFQLGFWPPFTILRLSHIKSFFTLIHLNNAGILVFQAFPTGGQDFQGCF